jgi:signal recognition particle receptor subunit beta
MATNNFLYKDAMDLREMVDLNDHLKELYRDDSSMKFPSIVVAGEQSHGKTSLIENITNLNLPRGTGIQTRVPTEIQLRQAPQPHYTIRYRPLGQSEYRTVEFSEETLEEKMRQIQFEVTGSDTEIADELITLTIERPDLLPLTIIDLPGFVVNRIDEGSGDIEQTMRNLYTRFIAEEQNTILCVLNAANDIENAQVLKICRQHDPKGLRTMICVTKIDLRTSMGYESYRRAAAKWNINRLFFTRNKTDEERQAKIKTDQVREKERAFIQNHPELRNFPSEQKGVLALRNYLVKLQKENIIPCLRQNYERIKELLKAKEREQNEIGKTIEEPDESRKFIQEKLRLIFAELKELYYNVNVDISSRNYFIKDHLENEQGTFVGLIKDKKILLKYTINHTEDETHVIVERHPRHTIFAELINTKKNKSNANISPETPSVTLTLPRGAFTLCLRLLSAKDFFIFRERVSQLYTQFNEMHGLEYFLDEQFLQVYENHEKSINTLNSLPDRDYTQVAEMIIFKDLVPQLKDDANKFRDWSKNFATNLIISRIQHSFENYKNLQALIIQRIHRFFESPFRKIENVIQILCENASKTSMTDPMYEYKVAHLRKIFKEENANQPNEFLSVICGPEVEFARLKEIFISNKKVYKNAIRAWAYISTLLPALKDNIIKTIQNHLIQKPINDLEYELYSMFDSQFFSNREEVARYMIPNSNLHQKQQSLKEDIARGKDAIDSIKRIPRKYAHLAADFDFIDDDEDVMEEELEELDTKIKVA